ncbi:DUF805 domain-containing protein [Sporolactobacillus shoreicorticis]|uniref:DUF805 domain-containing protein n=1 Tax=Sporolactobacillus shoreicorticis TaxID=1923877 RepID=A0ABW5S6K3_9BACL
MIYILYLLVTLIPNLSLGVRRFHDLNLSGWWYAGLTIIPIKKGHYIISFFHFNCCHDCVGCELHHCTFPSKEN